MWKYPRELIQPEIKPENRTGTIEQSAQNVEAVEKQAAFQLLIFRSRYFADNGQCFLAPLIINKNILKNDKNKLTFIKNSGRLVLPGGNDRIVRLGIVYPLKFSFGREV